MSALQHSLDAVKQQSRALFRREARQALQHYCRRQHIADILSCPTTELQQASDEPCDETMKALKRALRGVIRAKAKGCWYYDRQRHLALLQALSAELTILKAQKLHQVARRDLPFQSN